MSSSFPDRTCRIRFFVGVLARAGCVAGAVLAGVAQAADTYVLPEVELRVETNDNFDLEPGGSLESDVYGYIADLQALIGITTPRSDTSIRPRARLQEYPDRELERAEGFLDLNSMYRWERAQLRTVGSVSYRDVYNADLEGGAFDPDDPDAPTDPGTGARTDGQTVTRYRILPELTMSLSERTGIGGSFEYSGARYEDDDDVTNKDYNFVGGNAFLSWVLDERKDLRFGGYANRYEITDGSTETDAYGAEVELRSQWSETARLSALVFFEESDRTDYFPVPGEESDSGWGGTIAGTWKWQVTQLRFTAGRTFAGTGGRGKSELDQLRLEYDRDLTRRFNLRVVGRVESRRAIGSGDTSNDRDFARGDLVLRWMATPTMFIQGGYSYIWEDRLTDAGDAANNRFFISFGYAALDRRRR